MDQQLEKQKLDELSHSMIQRSTEAFKICLKLWSDIGYSHHEILNRCDQITLHFNQIYDDLLDTEEHVFKNIRDKLELYKYELKSLQEKLNVQMVKLNDANNNNSSQRNLDTVDFRIKQENGLRKKTMLEETEYYKSMINELSKIKYERKKKFNNLKQREKVLCNILNESEYSISDSSCLDQTELENFEHHLNNLSIEKRKRIGQLKQFCDEISILINDYKLTIEPDSSLHNLISLKDIDHEELNEKILSKQIQLNNFERYRQSMHKLNTKKEELIESIDLLRTDIVNFWNKFQLKNSDLEDYILNVPTYNQETHQILFAEYLRCCDLKTTRMKKMIEEKYNETLGMIEMCMLDEKLKTELELKITKEGYSEDMLEYLHSFLEKINEYAIKYETLFKSLREWTDMWAKFKEFEKAHMDPKRFHQRGYSSLNEQRERESYKKKLNCLQQVLIAECDSYLKQEGGDFLVQGQTIEEYMNTLKIEFDREKENMREERNGKSNVNSLRKKSVVKNFLTPQNQNIRSSIAQKSILLTQSPSSASLKTLPSSKYSITSSAKSSTSSLRMELKFDSTPNSSRVMKSTPRKIMNPINLNEKKKPSIAPSVMTQKNKRRSSIKEMSEKYKKNQRRSRVPFEGKLMNHQIPEIIVSNAFDSHESRCDFLIHENDSILKSANLYNSIHLTSSGVGSGCSSVSGLSHGC